MAGVRSRWHTKAPSKELLDTWLGTSTSVAFSSARELSIKPPRASGVMKLVSRQVENRARGEGVTDGTGNFALSTMFYGAGVLGEPVSWRG